MRFISYFFHFKQKNYRHLSFDFSHLRGSKLRRKCIMRRYSLETCDFLDSRKALFDFKFHSYFSASYILNLAQRLIVCSVWKRFLHDVYMIGGTTEQLHFELWPVWWNEKSNILSKTQCSNASATLKSCDPNIRGDVALPITV